MMYQPNVTIKSIILLIGILYSSPLLQAENEPAPRGIFEVLGYREVVNIELTFDLAAVQADNRSDTEYPAQLSFKDDQRRQQTWDITVRGRGKFRRAKCTEMPPLKLNFSKKDLKAAGLADFDDFKLVTYCVNDYQTARELLLKEYLVYKMYNQLTDASFRVQLLRITYRDTHTGKRKKQMGFLIEDTAQLRARIGAEKAKEERVLDADRFHPQHRKTAAVFEYLIGNTDWEITYAKNVKHVLQDSLLVPVPYDFDFSAIVDASYATAVATHYGQTSRYERIYLGFERSDPELRATLAYFKTKKKDLYQTISNFRLLDAFERTKMIQYLDSFFTDQQPLKFPVKDMAATPVSVQEQE